MGMDLLIVTKELQEGEKQRFRREGKAVSKARAGAGEGSRNHEPTLSSVPAGRKATRDARALALVLGKPSRCGAAASQSSVGGTEPRGPSGDSLAVLLPPGADLLCSFHDGRASGKLRQRGHCGSRGWRASWPGIRIRYRKS